MDARDRWLEERNASPPPGGGNRWLANYDPQQIAAIQRSAWDGRSLTANHFLKSNLTAGHTQTAWFNDLIDRRIVHTKGDRHPFCSSHIRADENFIGLCSQRLRPTPDRMPNDEHTRLRIAERHRADEEKVKQRYRERKARQEAAERQMAHAPRPGSRQAKDQREALEAKRPASARAAAFSDQRTASATSTLAAAEPAHERWQRQFGDGRGHTERLTGRYVHSLGDVGRMERVPAERRTPGRSRITTPKADAFFSGSLRDYDPPSPPRQVPALTHAGGGGNARAPWRMSDWRSRGKSRSSVTL